MKKINKAYVLGGSGYVGQYLVEELAKDNIETTCLINKTPIKTKSENITQIQSSLADFDWHQLDGNIPDVIFHTARMSGKDKKSRLEAGRINAAANQKMLEWMKSLDNPPLLVFVSGTLVYGSHGKTKINETQTPNPTSFQKEYFEAEKPVLEELKKGDLPVMIGRPCWIYGPGSWLEAFYLKPIWDKKTAPVYGNGENIMTFIHVKDCGAQIKHIAEQGKAGNIYNLFTGSAKTQKEFVKILSDHYKVPIKHKPLWWLQFRFEKAVREAFEFSLDLETLHKEVFDTYKPYFPDFEEGLKSVL
jgi:nucleoside-diphosphate-sugar epimerase